MLVELEAWFHIVPVVKPYLEPLGLQLLHQRAYSIGHRLQLLRALVYRHEHHMQRGDLRWNHQPIVIRVRHDPRPHQARRYPPRGSPHVVHHPLIVHELHIEGPCEILPEEVRSASLQSLPILHQRLYAEGVHSPGKSFARALYPHYHGERQPLAGKLFVHPHHSHRLLARLPLGGMRRVPLLPQELRGP